MAHDLSGLSIFHSLLSFIFHLGYNISKHIFLRSHITSRARHGSEGVKQQQGLRLGDGYPIQAWAHESHERLFNLAWYS